MSLALYTARLSFDFVYNYNIISQESLLHQVRKSQKECFVTDICHLLLDQDQISQI